jgi:hypothetical protein
LLDDVGAVEGFYQLARGALRSPAIEDPLREEIGSLKEPEESFWGSTNWAVGELRGDVDQSFREDPLKDGERLLAVPEETFRGSTNWGSWWIKNKLARGSLLVCILHSG